MSHRKDDEIKLIEQNRQNEAETSILVLSWQYFKISRFSHMHLSGIENSEPQQTILFKAVEIAEHLYPPMDHSCPETEKLKGNQFTSYTRHWEW